VPKPFSRCRRDAIEPFSACRGEQVRQSRAQPRPAAPAAPRTMQAWKSLAEIDRRTIMRDGQWTPA
jgi:hypothetical protein